MLVLVSVSRSGVASCNNEARGRKDENGEDKEDDEESIPAELCNEGRSRNVAEAGERVESSG